ncbi:MAG: hypothetical protein BroJett024_43010 [Alphaproteobacteria bacterium]|nr:MAG: hypothetical protein BroJett024_43010 [Alphaproteobacteria bacterium]
MAMWTTPPDRISGVWRAYRHTDRRFQPLWYGGRTSSVIQESGRWHEEGADVAQYLSLSINGAWAERCRYESIRDDRRRLEDRRMLWELLVQDDDIADLSTFDSYRACGLAPETALGPHDLSQPLAVELVEAGYRGVLSPSAAFDQADAINLTLFGERLEDHHHVAMPRPEDNPRPGLFIPVLTITEAGSPTEFAMQHTCYRPGHHRTFAAWCKMNGYSPVK